MPSDNVRQVRITINNDGEVLRVRDPGLDDSRPWIDAVFPKLGQVYGWDLSSRLTGAQIRRPSYHDSVAATASDQADRADRQTLQVPGTTLVKLDCGFWGHYLRARPGQRDFGIIEGPNVWLCSYRSTVRTTNPATLIPAAGTKARMLIDRIEASGRYVSLLRHATIPPNSEAAVPAEQKLYLCFPDLHLPEQWPDLYPATARLAPGRNRAALRYLLRQSQCRAGPANDSLLTPSNLNILNACLDDWAAGGSRALSVTFDASVTIILPDDPEGMPIYSPNSITLNCTKDQVLAEKNHLDREIQAKSTWFYPAGAAIIAGSPIRRPLTSDPNEVEVPEDNLADDPITLMAPTSSLLPTDVVERPPDTTMAVPGHMAAPAADLADFLFVVRELQRAQGASNIKVIQVGDLYELWMNREFMYKDAPVIANDELGQTSRDGVCAISSAAVLNYTEYEFKDSFQLRQGKEWSEAGGAAHAANRYVYHRWTRPELYRRHDVTGPIAAVQQARLQRRLLERIESVTNWSWPEPASDPLLPALRTWMRTKPPTTFTRRNLRGATETRWNNLVLELLQDLQAVRIHGNHDGYRSDARLLLSRSSPAASHEWFSELGVWVEHSHRWDYFNRDGVAMGAGMTNVVYYHNEELIAASGGAAAALLRQEQCFFQAGAAQWYLLVNYGDASSWFNSGIHKFGVYVGGHTHGPDLVKVSFEQSNAAIAADWAEQRQRDIERAQRRAQQVATDIAARARETAADAAARARQMLADASRRAREIGAGARRRFTQLLDYWPF
jgi:hypothetical protein